MTETQHFLVADDDQNILIALKMLLTSQGHQVTLASQPQQVMNLIKERSFSGVLLDLNFNLDTTSGEEGLVLIEQIHQIDDNLPVIVMTGWATVELAVSAMQKGAADFIQKPWENERLLSVLNTQVTLAEQRHKSQLLSQENQLLKADAQQHDEFIAHSPAMQQVLDLIKQVAPSDVNILITGDNGTGKSLLANYLHYHSNREHHSLIQVNMGAIAENLFESEMFGHIKGAFTDAKENRIGRFELADQGSLFLDEIGNIPLSQQAKLLRVLESQQFEKVGSSKTQQVNVRVISATNANIEKLISAGEFRQDLFYRLNSIEIRLPSLAERQEDIVPLAEHFIEKYGKKYKKLPLALTHNAKQQLLDYEWPGNIRELSHSIERAVILSSKGKIDASALSLTPTAPKIENSLTNNSKQEQTLEELEKAIIIQRISHHQGNMMQAAKSLGLSRSAFYRRIDKYQL